MKAMILAAGGGTRLYPLTFTLAKPMATVMNKPVLEHIINHISKHGFNELMINLHNFGDQIENYFRDGRDFGVKISYSHEKEPLGTAGGVKNVEHFFDDTFMVIGGDDLLDVNLGELIAFHKEKKALATIGLSYEKEVEHYGVVVTDQTGKILEFQEKPRPEEAKSHWVNNGIYIFEPEILDYIPAGKFYDFGSQLFPRLKDEGAPFYGCECRGYWKDIGNLVEYRQAYIDCLEKKLSVQFEGTEIKPGVWIAEGVKLPDDITLIPPVLIGKNCQFGENVHLEGPLVLGNNNRIDDNAVIVRSMMWDSNQISKNVELVDCLMGNSCKPDSNQKFKETTISSEMKYIFEDYFHRRMKDVMEADGTIKL
jgi:NDP-sugar pyrophosphorylase family protein